MTLEKEKIHCKGLREFDYHHNAFVERVKKNHQSLFLQPKKMQSKIKDDSCNYVSKNDIDWENTVKEWLECFKYIEKEKELREKLIILSQGKNSRGFGVTVQKVTRKGNIEYDKIEELKTVNLDAYRKESSDYWKITRE
jgi:hypothetical protein